MHILENHIIKKKTILLAGEYAHQGMHCTRVMEERTILLVGQPPKRAINDSLKYIGSSLKGATESARFLLGIRKLCPIMVNPSLDICLFPVHSPDFEFNIWFNPEHILRVVAKKCRSLIYLSNGLYIEVDLKLPLLNTRIHNANQLRKITTYNSQGQLQLCGEPKRELLLTKEKNGHYNFHILEKEEKKD